MEMNELIEKLKKFSSDNYLLTDFSLDRELIETEPEDEWRCWKLGNEIYLNITLTRKNKRQEQL